MTVFVANTNVLDLIGLKSAIEDTFINDATVTVTLKYKDTGAEIEGQTWPTTMEYIDASDGDYRAIISNEAELVHKRTTIAVIEADGGEDRVGHWEFEFKPVTREDS